MNEIRRLTELAAIACDIRGKWCEIANAFLTDNALPWLPHESKTDSFDLMCDLEIDIQFRVVGGMRVIATGPGVDAISVSCEHMTFRTAARLAILQAAAAVGERIQKR